MKKRWMIICLATICLAMTVGCGKKNGEDNTADVQTSNVTETETAKTDTSSDDAVKESDEVQAKAEEAKISDEELYDAFLANHEKVYFSKCVPTKYFHYDEPMFDAKDGLYLNELLAAYRLYYWEQTDGSENMDESIQYAYIDCGEDGKKELVISAEFPTSGQAKFILQAIDEKVELLYVAEGYYRERADIANPYGLVAYSGSSSAFENGYSFDYVDAKGKSQLFYTEVDTYAFEENFGEISELGKAAFELEMFDYFEGKYVLRQVHLSEYPKDPTVSDVEEYEKSTIYTVEKDQSGSFVHTPDMYAADGELCKLFEKAGLQFVSPEELDELLKERAQKLGISENARQMDVSTVEYTEMTDVQLGAVYGADINDGTSTVAQALCAYKKFLSDPLSFRSIMLSDCITDFGDMPGMIYGFAVRDVNQDDLPELLIDFGPTYYYLMQQIYIYQFDPSTGRVRYMTHTDMGNGNSGNYYLDEYSLDEDYVQYHKETEHMIAKTFPDYATSLFGDSWTIDPLIAGMYNGNLVTFYCGTEEDSSTTMMWYDYVNDSASYYVEDLQYDDSNVCGYSFEIYGDYSEDPAKVYHEMRPIMFYDITPKNLDLVLREDYNDEDVSAGEVLDVLRKKSDWFAAYDFDSYEGTVNSYRSYYGEDNEYVMNIRYIMKLLVQTFYEFG